MKMLSREIEFNCGVNLSAYLSRENFLHITAGETFGTVREGAIPGTYTIVIAQENIQKLVDFLNLFIWRPVPVPKPRRWWQISNYFQPRW